MRRLIAASAIAAGSLLAVAAPASASRDTTCVDSWRWWCGTYSQYVDPTFHWWQLGLNGWTR